MPHTRTVTVVEIAIQDETRIADFARAFPDARATEDGVFLLGNEPGVYFQATLNENEVWIAKIEWSTGWVRVPKVLAFFAKEASSIIAKLSRSDV